MSESTSTGGGGRHRTIQIPSILTTSLRAVLETFGSDIYALRARGSVETANATAIDGLQEYNLSRTQQTNHGLELEYESIYADGEVSNPLTPEACDDILDEVGTVLDRDDSPVEPDLSVTALTLRVTSERLEAVTPARSPEFDLHFVADSAEPPVREPTKRLNARRGLYSELGFNIQNLNLRSVIETETKYRQQTDGKYMSWGGPTRVRANSPDRLAIRINQDILPDDYGMLKPYTVVDEDQLELSEDDIEERCPTPQPGTAFSGGES